MTVALLVLLAVLPLLPALVFVLRSPWPEHAALDDMAILELRTMEAGRGRHLVGPYSRFGWSHPGPAEFYLLYPFHVLGGRKTGALSLGAVFLNGASMVALAWMAVRLFGIPRGAALILLFNGVLLTLENAGLGGAWNPVITVIPFGLFVLLAVGFALEGFRFLPGAAVVASFVVQTHLGYAPALAAASVVALWERSRSVSLRADAARARRTVALTVGLLALIWLPPVIEQIRESPGNMTLIVRFFREHGTSHEFRDVFEAVSVPLSAVPLRLATLLIPSTSDQRAVGAGLMTLALVTLLPLARRRAAAANDAPARVIGTIAVALVAASFWAALNVRDELHWYLLLWVSVVGFAGWGALAVTLLGPFAEDGMGAGTVRTRRTVIVAAVAVGLLVTGSNVRSLRKGASLPVDSSPNEALRELTGVVKEFLVKSRIEKPLLSIGSHDEWVPAAGLILDLYKAGLPFAVQEDWWFMFGRSFRQDGRESTTFVIGDATLDAALALRPDYEFVGRGGQTAVYRLKDPKWLERHVRRAPGRVLDSRDTRGETVVVVDGRVPAPGTAWDSSECLVLGSMKSYVTVQVPEGPVVAVVVSADNNDTYEVAVSHDGTAFEVLGVLPDVPELGMRERALFSPKLRGAKALRISPRTGDGAFSVGEVSFVFDDVSAPSR